MKPLHTVSSNNLNHEAQALMERKYDKLLAACRRERSSGHASCSDHARVLHDMGRSDSMEPTHMQNIVGDAVLFELEECRCSCATPKIRSRTETGSGPI
ncbi:hypothetical protein Krac_0536 [Ktedonobacter racemifer DSM 44963]|uniref:Uncharacterized protein n=1 Tax=Ktedonobacter racemifer DSM 44963 TaxID=485913 RepID=D6U7Y8_KTERA|nr:hypothetical protein Krac_0536 [Ktedonobacter racemifer DSM 44963]